MAITIRIVESYFDSDFNGVQTEFYKVNVDIDGVVVSIWGVPPQPDLSLLTKYIETNYDLAELKLQGSNIPLGCEPTKERNLVKTLSNLDFHISKIELAIAKVVMDEINILRQKAGLTQRTWTQFKDAIKANL